MDKNAIKKYAVWARNELIARVTQKAEQYEITGNKTTPKDAESINGRLLTEAEKNQRKALIEKIQADGFEQVMEEVAYTWFNRFTALRFMEVNNYLPSHTRVFTNEAGEFKPQILADAIQLDLEGLDMDKVFELKEANKTEELYKYLLITQCNALSSILPRMFQKIEDYTELLLPDYLLREGSVIEQMISIIPEDNFDVNTEGGQIEIIGWLYQYYISEKHEAVVDPLHGKVVRKEEVPAATQLFTTDWVVRYLIDNSVGRYWIERNQDSKLADNLTFFVKPKSGKIKTINEKITPQDITTFDPCVGSGHFLIYAFDVLMKIYIEYGYSERDAAAEIVKNNLFGLDIDGRASQLAYFSVMMKARQYDRRFFSRGIQPHIYEISESNTADRLSVDYFIGNDEILRKDVEEVLHVLKDAKEYGSILQMPTVDFGRINERFEQLGNEINMYNSYLLGDFRTLISPVEMMSKKYAVVATNPPYLNKYDPDLKEYIIENYKLYSGDLFSVFMYRNFGYCKEDGYTGFMTPFVWLFINTYENLREFIIKNKAIATLIQMEYSAYEEATVPICSFVIKNGKENDNGCYFRLSAFRGGMEVQKQKVLEAQKNKECGYYFETSIHNYELIPGIPISYWGSDIAVGNYQTFKSVGDKAFVKKGMFTGQNDLFFRKWYEVMFTSIDFGIADANEVGYRHYVPMNSGGAYRRWYGNRNSVIKFDKEHYDIITKNKGHRNPQFYFKKAAPWTKITSGKFSMRLSEEGFINNDASMAAFEKDVPLEAIVGLMNSVVAQHYLSLVNESLNYTSGNVASVPFALSSDDIKTVSGLVNECVGESKKDWDSFEMSWDFVSHPLVPTSREVNGKTASGKETYGCKKPYVLVSEMYKQWEQVCEDRFNRLQRIEEELNSTFIRIYGLQDELTPDVDDKDVTVRRADKQRDIRSLLSYAVGCMFGRYSLDFPGLAYAGGTWDATKYSTFLPDKDAIIPICDDEYFDDDIVGRFIQFIEVVYGEEALEANLKFIADALGGKGTSREIIRNYFINDFYADHLKVYQKRPIYWLFDSGKKNGFKCLVYMHRYQSDTIARIRTDYVHEQQSRYRTAIVDLENRINSAGTSERVKLNKRLSNLQAQSDEIRKFEEKIHHLADQMIGINLDDGVKHNYEIFKDVLSKIR